MYTAILTTHKIAVTLFFLHYLLKLGLLLFNRKDNLAAYTKVTRIPEMILSVLFLVSGIWLLVQPAAAVNTLMIVKLVCVFASIPLAIIGFRKGNKALATIAVFLIVSAYGLAEMAHKAKSGGKVDTSTVNGSPIEVGKLIYSNSCASCHGADGKAGVNGAKDLSASQLSPVEQKDIIRNGKNAMPPFKDLTYAQVDGLLQYLGTLKQ